MLTNDELITSFKIRSENYNEVQRLLKEINQILYFSQRLRGDVKLLMKFKFNSIFPTVGHPASKMMSNFKEALEQKNIEKLIHIMEISG